jgi:hypothetical protein
LVGGSEIWLENKEGSMKSSRWFALGLALSLGLALLVALLILPAIGAAQPLDARIDRTGLQRAASDKRPADSTVEQVGYVPPVAGRAAVTTSSASPAGLGPMDVSGSFVNTRDCYQPGQSQTLCFTVYNGSTDAEWLDGITMTFPTLLGAWSVSCKSQDAADSSGSPVNLTCNKSFDYELFFTDTDVEPASIGEISAGSSWGFCVGAIIPSGYIGPRIINWGVSGDQELGSTMPHDITGTLEIEQCMPLMLNPASLSIEGCNGVTQTHTFELWNNTGSGGTFDLTYHTPSNNATFVGPDAMSLSAGETVTFAVQLKPDLCLNPGDKVTATLQVAGNSQFDESTLVQTITNLAGWGSRQESPVPSMDSVVVWASHADGGLWAIGGYGANGATQRYDPATDAWTTHTPETTITPTIEYPMDGCYGLNGAGDEVVILFPDTIVTNSLHVYNITQDAWYTEPVPGFYPVEGRWGQDIVSLLNTPGANQNVCYLSGGSDRTGGGRTRDLWVYYPMTNSGSYLEAFPPLDNPFNFHASWYVPWVGNQGAICVAGGVDHNHQINNSTRCYDLETKVFNTPNADLGPLPEPWWGMADGWQVYDGRYQIWIANGVAQDGTLLPASAYADATTGGFLSGPELPVSLYRLEGDGWDGQFYTLQGAAGGFSYSAHNQLLVHCPTCYSVHLPLLLREVGN